MSRALLRQAKIRALLRRDLTVDQVAAELKVPRDVVACVAAAMELLPPQCPTCPRCQATPMGSSYRWNGSTWEHRCSDEHAQAGHHPIEGAATDSAPAASCETGSDALGDLGGSVLTSSWPDMSSVLTDPSPRGLFVAECFVARSVENDLLPNPPAAAPPATEVPKPRLARAKRLTLAAPAADPVQERLARAERQVRALEARVGALQERLVELTTFPASPRPAPIARSLPIYGAPSGKTLHPDRGNASDLEVGALVYPEAAPALPRTRAECPTERPCPHVGCRHHLFLEVNKTGSVRFNHPDLEVWDLQESCALDVAERGGETMEAVGEVLGVTRERVRQIEIAALARLRGHDDLEDTELVLAKADLEGAAE